MFHHGVTKKLTVIVSNFRNPELLRLCLRSVQEATETIDTEIIVSDGMTDEKMEMMMREEFSDVQFIPHASNVGLSALVEDALKEARGEYIVYMNGDIVLLKDTFLKLLSFIESHKDVGIVAPRLLNFDGTEQETCFRFYRLITIVYRRTFLKYLPFAKRHLDWFLMKTIGRDKPIEPDWILGAIYMFSRKAIEKVGFMDRRFFLYFEDTDWCRRFWEEGYRVVFYPGARAYHYHGKGSARGGMFAFLFNKLARIHIESAIKYFWKYLGKENPHKEK